MNLKSSFVASLISEKKFGRVFGEVAWLFFMVSMFLSFARLYVLSFGSRSSSSVSSSSLSPDTSSRFCWLNWLPYNRSNTCNSIFPCFVSAISSSPSSILLLLFSLASMLPNSPDITSPFAICFYYDCEIFKLLYDKEYL